MGTKIIAILDRSAGNDSVGEMWQETKIFEADNTLGAVLKWACLQTHTEDISKFKGNLKLTIAQ